MKDNYNRGRQQAENDIRALLENRKDHHLGAYNLSNIPENLNEYSQKEMLIYSSRNIEAFYAFMDKRLSQVLPPEKVSIYPKTLNEETGYAAVCREFSTIALSANPKDITVLLPAYIADENVTAQLQNLLLSQTNRLHSELTGYLEKMQQGPSALKDSFASSADGKKKIPVRKKKTKLDFKPLDTDSKGPENNALGLDVEAIERYAQMNGRVAIGKGDAYATNRLDGLKQALAIIESGKININNDLYFDITDGASNELVQCCREHAYNLTGKLRKAVIALMEGATLEEIGAKPPHSKNRGKDGRHDALQDVKTLFQNLDPNALYTEKNENCAKRQGKTAIATMEYRVAQRVLTHLFDGLSIVQSEGSVREAVNQMSQWITFNNEQFKPAPVSQTHRPPGNR